MSNQLEKLKSSIKKEYTKLFELNLMKTSGFIPVDKRQGDFWVVINKAGNVDKSHIENLVKDKIKDLTPKFIPVDTSTFNSLIETLDVKEEPKTPSATDNSNEPSAEEMLVSIGWITKEQLHECQQIALQKKITVRCNFS